MSVVLAFAALIAIVAFAFFLMWGMPSILRGHHGDGDSVGGPTTYAGHDSHSHSNVGSDGGGGHGGDGSH